MKTLMSLVLALLIAASIGFYFFSKPDRYHASRAPSMPASAGSSPAPFNPPPPGPPPDSTPASAVGDAPSSQPAGPDTGSPGQSSAPTAEPLPQPLSTPGTQPSSDPSAAYSAPRTVWPPASAWTEIEERVLVLTNLERGKAGLRPVSREDGLRASARAQSLDMLERHFFDHVNPSGEDPSDRIGRIHRTLVGTAGENLWRATGPSYRASPDLAAIIVDAWMNSPHHRENILRAEFTHLGVGVVLEGDEVRATQNFSGVKAYLTTPLPASLASGTAVDLSTAAPQAQMYKLQPVGGPKENGPPTKIGNTRLAAPPGVYRIEFYFSEDGTRFSVYEGPQLTVR